MFSHMSPNHLPSDDVKLGAHSSPSSRDSSPRPDSVSPVQQECIVRTLSIVSKLKKNNVSFFFYKFHVLNIYI